VSWLEHLILTKQKTDTGVVSVHVVATSMEVLRTLSRRLLFQCWNLPSSTLRWSTSRSTSAYVIASPVSQRLILTILQDKRDFVVRRLREMGFVIKYVPDSTFYL
jgi:hypothetical protein